MKTINYSYRFNVGDFECRVIRDTVSPLDLDFLFSSIPAPQLQKKLDRYAIPPGEVMDVMCLYLKTPEHNILIDAGWGTRPEPDTGKLLENLKLQKIPPEEIDAIVISHSHPDHIGGLTDDKGRPVFPNARYYVSQKAWDFWTSNPDLAGIDKNVAHTMLTMARKNLIPLKDRINLIDDDTEILPGVKYINAPGHSPDHGVLVISSGGSKLLYAADLFHHLIQMACPDLCAMADLIPEEAVKARTRLARQAMAEKMTVFACHLPYPGIGHITPRGEAFLWQPIE
jgi:glyoxylase-like metal-dependent hydrolase (beta-lactamase superfamily II)